MSSLLAGLQKAGQVVRMYMDPIGGVLLRSMGYCCVASSPGLLANVWCSEQEGAAMVSRAVDLLRHDASTAPARMAEPEWRSEVRLRHEACSSKPAAVMGQACSRAQVADLLRRSTSIG